MADSRKHRKTRLILPLRLWIGKKLFGSGGRHGVRVSPSRMIKGPCPKSELEAMKYVAEHTSIPVPKIFNTHYYDDGPYIEMEYVRGMSLQAAWCHGHLSQDQKKHIITEVAGYIRQLRNLEPPREGIVASASLHEIWDHRVGPYGFGPFTSHEEFHSYLRANITIEEWNEDLDPEVTKCHSRRHRSCFTHAHLAPWNIMVDNGKVSAIVDWKFGGWYPEYWEYTKAHYFPMDRPEWYDGLKNAMGGYDDELEAERYLWRRLENPQALLQGRVHSDV